MKLRVKSLVLRPKRRRFSVLSFLFIVLDMVSKKPYTHVCVGYGI